MVLRQKEALFEKKISDLLCRPCLVSNVRQNSLSGLLDRDFVKPYYIVFFKKCRKINCSKTKISFKLK